MVPFGNQILRTLQFKRSWWQIGSGFQFIQRFQLQILALLMHETFIFPGSLGCHRDSKQQVSVSPSYEARGIFADYWCWNVGKFNSWCLRGVKTWNQLYISTRIHPWHEPGGKLLQVSGSTFLLGLGNIQMFELPFLCF